jgi:hypothetical protein
MASLPYMQFYPGEYLADTAHLTTEQHGAYLLLLFNYWQRGKALDNSNERLTSVVRLSNERWNDIKPVLKEFFDIENDTWFHKRMERDLADFRASLEQKKKAGKASAEKRYGKSNGRSTGAEQPLHGSLNEKKRKEKTIQEKNIYGEFKNVLLTDIEYDKLKTKFNGSCERWIDKLSIGIESHGYKYKSHYATILNWAADEVDKPKEQKSAYVPKLNPEVQAMKRERGEDV